MQVIVSYLCLHHEGSMHSQIVNNAVNIDNIFPFDLEDQPVDGYEGACAPHPSTVGKKQTEEREENIRLHLFQTEYECVGRLFASFAPPAVDHSGGVPGVLVHVLSDQMSEADQKLCGFWNTVVRPGCEVELTN